MANNDNRYRRWILNRKNKNDGIVKSSKPSQYIINERKINQSQKPTSLNNRRTLNEINLKAQLQRDQLGRRPLNIKDKKALDAEIDYNVLLETLKNRSSKILGSKVLPEIPLITGNFLVRENSFIIATENDKLIELDIN